MAILQSVKWQLSLRAFLTLTRRPGPAWRVPPPLEGRLLDCQKSIGTVVSLESLDAGIWQRGTKWRQSILHLVTMAHYTESEFCIICGREEHSSTK